MMSLLCLVLMIAPAQAVGAAYTSVGAGACRGNGGSSDKVNSRFKNNVLTEALCEAECDALATCAGFSWESSGDKACILCTAPDFEH